MAATYIVVTNASANTLSLEGDNRNPAVSIARAETANINMIDVLGNDLLCSTLSTMVTAGTVTITRGGTTVTAAQLTAYKQGADMDRVDYDTDDDNIVDRAEAIDTTSRTAVATAASPYTVLSTDTLIQTDSTAGAIGLTLPAGVDGKTYTIIDGAGTAGTDAITITPDGAETINGAATYTINSAYQSIEIYYDGDSNDWKVMDVAGFDPTTIETNSTRTAAWLAGNLPAQTVVNNAASPYTVLATDVQLNVLATTGVVECVLPAGVDGKTYTIKDEDGGAGTNTITITPDGAETIEGAATMTLLHNYDSVTLYYDTTTDDWKVLSKVENLGKLVRVSMVAAGGTGGATEGTLSVQVSDLSGVAITRAVNLRLDISDTDMAGALDAATNAQFNVATTGAFVIGGAGGAAAIVTTDATGLFECSLENAADETVYFSATTADGGFATNAAGCVVAECITESATWSA